MALNLRQLEIIRSILHTGSVTGAARRLGISQPAVSQTVRAAEDYMGFRLFVRDKGRLIPTHELLTLHAETTKVLDGLEVVQRLVEDLRDGRSGLVTVAATPSLAHNLLPDAVQRFLHGRPKVRVKIESMVNSEVVEQVTDHRVDLGLVLAPAWTGDAAIDELHRGALVCVIPERHRLAGQDHVDLGDIQGETLISFSRNLPLGALVEEAFRQHGARRDVVVEVSNSFMACCLVRADVGVAIIDPFSPMTGSIPGLVALPLRPRIEIKAVALSSGHRPLSRTADAFLEILRTARWSSAFLVSTASLALTDPPSTPAA
jgi:DNA-binding transcriptional LysR family regulator